MQQPTRSRPAPGPLLVLVGGILVFVCGFLDWGRVTPPLQLAQPVTVKGSAIVLAGGAILVALGVATWAMLGKTMHIVLGALAGVAGLVVTLITGVTIVSKDVLISTAANKYAESSRFSADRIEDALKQLNDRGLLGVDVKIGLWLGLIGGILVLAGGILVIVAASKEPAPLPREPGMPFEAPIQPEPAAPLPAAPRPPLDEPGPDVPQGGGVGPGPAPPLPPSEPPRPGEPGSGE